MKKPLAGMVIPVFQSRYIKSIVATVLSTTRKTDLVLCVVNDGRPELKRELEPLRKPGLVSVIHIDQNRGFAGANNVGWRHLTAEYPSLKYLGTINDDTVPKAGWLDNMVQALETYPKTALAMPVMEQKANWWSRPKSYSTWRFENGSGTMRPDKKTIKGDTFVTAVNGFCFVARAEALEQASYFDERYKNSCEDLDIGLKLVTNGWRMVVCKDSRVYHHGGKSRGIKEAQTDCRYSKKLLEEKWGRNLEIYNNLDVNGFWKGPALNQS